MRMGVWVGAQLARRYARYQNPGWRLWRMARTWRLYRVAEMQSSCCSFEGIRELHKLLWFVLSWHWLSCGWALPGAHAESQVWYWQDITEHGT